SAPRLRTRKPRVNSWADWKPAEAYYRISNSLLLPATPHGPSTVKSRPLFFTDYKPLKGGLMRRRRTAPTSIIRIQESGQLANTPGAAVSSGTRIPKWLSTAYETTSTPFLYYDLLHTDVVWMRTAPWHL
ncbi:hypothetical protein CPAR01_11179, partial [Colletotrichum paranaense]